MMTLGEIRKAVNGIYICSGNVTDPIFLDEMMIRGISKDSNSIIKDDLFIAIKGERFDGNNFIKEVIRNGALTALTDRVNIELDQHTFAIYVKDTKKALLQLAEYYRGKRKIPAIAVTGSVGKTTTKEIIYSVLSQKYCVLKTEGNYNNEIGLPFTVFNLNSSHELAVYEMGMNHFGEINNLSNVVKPSVAVITNIGTAHIGNLGSREGILKAKCEIFNHMQPDGIAVLNYDDKLLRKVELQDHIIIKFGFGDDCAETCDFYAKDIVNKGMSGTEFTIVTPKGSVRVFIKQPGSHMISTALAASACAQMFGLSLDEIKHALCSLSCSSLNKGRMEIIECKSLTIINGSYNASPESMLVSLDVLNNSSPLGRKTAILGDMLELGDRSISEHIKLAVHIKERQLDRVICIGQMAYHTYDSLLDSGIEAHYFQTTDEFIKQLHCLISACDTVLIKASRSMGFEKIVNTLTGNTI